MTPNLPPPSIPVEFARPVPSVSQPAPSGSLNVPGPYSAQPQIAPRLPTPTGPSGVPGAVVGAGAVAQGATGATVLPAVILSVPLAIAGGETGRPIGSAQTESDFIKRANQPGGLPGNSIQKPGNSAEQNPANPPGGKAKPKPPAPPPKDGQGIPVTWSVTVEVNYGYGNPSVIAKNFSGYSGDVWGVSVDAQGSNLTQNNRIAWKTWTRSPGEGGGAMSVVNAVPSAPPPSVPVDPRPPGVPVGSSVPAQTIPPNPSAKLPPPNPSSPGPIAPLQNPTKPNPPLSNPPPKVTPSNPNQPISPVNPNPSSPTAPSTPANPTKPNPVNPNPSSPTAPSTPANPTQQNPNTPTGPIAPGPIIPIPNIPGPLVPTGPSTITTTKPIPNGPNNPPRNPCADPCVDIGLNRDAPVVIQIDRFVSCTRNLFGVPLPFDKVSVTVPQLLAPALSLLLNNQAQILKEVSCSTCDEAVAAIPDWWQLRLGSNRPQLLVLYARKFGDGTWDKAKYVLSIPHWSKPKVLTKIEDFPVYDKGDFQGTRVFADNSKLIVNAVSASEALRVLDKICESLSPAIVNESDTSVADRRGNALRKIKVFPRMARYFASGQKNLEPTWSVDFRK